MNPWVALGAVLALAGAATGLYGLGYGHGDVAGAARVQGAWDAAKDRAEQEARLIRGAGIRQAEQYATTVTTLRDANAKAAAALQKALRSKLDCPASGEVGDVRVNVDLINSMFNRAVPERRNSD